MELTLAQALQLAVTHHQAGELQEAERLYRAILQAEPYNPDANHNLGLLVTQMKRPAAGLAHLKLALEASPGQWQYWLSYIDALVKTNQTEDARRVLAEAQALGLQGIIGQKLVEQLTGASYGAEVMEHMVTLFNQGRHAEVEAQAREMTANSPLHGFGWKALGAALQQQGRSAEALQVLQKAVELMPSDATARSNLASCLNILGRYEEALVVSEEALRLSPDNAGAYINFGNALYESGRLSEAEANYVRALELKPDLVEAHNSLGVTLKELGRLTEAEASYRRALTLRPDHADVHNNLGAVLREQGHYSEAQASYRQALALKPDYAEAHSNLIFALSCDVKRTPLSLLEEARRYGRMVTAKCSRRLTAWQCSKQPERLRVGLVSGDLRTHPVGYFLESILVHLDPTRLELVAYSSRSHEDELTARIKVHFAAWRSLVALNDEAAARQIHDDGIHILIDLVGHTAHNRLPVFAWKPAPVQVSWLGYFGTTGVPEMDYLLADPVSVPESQRKYFTETVWRLPDTRLCFTEPVLNSKLAVTPLPAVSNGYVTFGCFQNLAKINDHVLTLWGRILNALPQAKLRLQNKQMSNLATREHFLHRLAYAGIVQERVKIEGLIPREAYLAAHAQVDIILDTFPYPGGTTTCEALWMGVPTLTLIGDTLLARQGASLLACAGLEDWIASDEEDYVARALAHAVDIGGLLQLRARLREQVLNSPLFNAPLFASRLEEALQEMWGRKMRSWNLEISEASTP